jgi:uncharacterized membrane protein
MEICRKREWLFGILIIAIVLTDISIIFNVPFFRHLLGFFLITLIPGTIVLMMLNTERLETADFFVLAVGLSLILSMGAGLLINFVLPYFGDQTPLSTISLLVSLTIIDFFLLGAAYLKKSPGKFNFHLPCLNRNDKICLILAWCVLFLNMTGVYVLGTCDFNMVLLSSFLLIAFLVVLVVLNRENLSPSVYPLIILVISVALILIYPMRSSHILGIDTHMEYYFFQSTLDAFQWKNLENGLLDSCLSISILPCLYTSLTGISPERVFRFYSPLLFSIVPVIVYLVARKYVDRYLAFLASIFFMSHWTFMYAESLARTVIAVLFIALVVLCLFSEKIYRPEKSILVYAFIVGAVLSHYSSSFIFFILLATAFVLTAALSVRHCINKNLTYGMIVVFFTAIVVWDFIVISSPLRMGFQFIQNIIETQSMSSAPVLASLTGKKLPFHVISQVSLVIRWITFLLMGYGVIASLAYWFRTNRDPDENRPRSRRPVVDVEFVLIGLISGFILVLTVIIPFISVGYDLDRVYLLISVMLSPFFIIGGIQCLKTFKVICARLFHIKGDLLSAVFSPAGVLTCIVVLNFLFTMGVPHQFAGDTASFLFHSTPGASGNVMVTDDRDTTGAHWLKAYGDRDPEWYTDVYAEKVLQSQANIRFTEKIPLNSSGFYFKDGYLFTITDTNSNNRIYTEWRDTPNLGPRYHEMIRDMSKIFTNNGSIVWVTQS